MQEIPLAALARIPAGDFYMGSDIGEADERPRHRVHIDEFSIGIYTVTNDEYEKFVRESGHRPPNVYELPVVVGDGTTEREHMFRRLAAPYVWTDDRPPTGRGMHPVVLVRLEDAVAYCGWLSRITGEQYRLPTEAEWERAARGGVEGNRFPWGDEPDAAMANVLPDAALKSARGTQPVGSYPPNGFGLYDMIGNVWEWTLDWYAPYAARGSVRNPEGPPEGRLRIVRGGAWCAWEVEHLTCSHRHVVPPDTYSYSIGFRVVRVER